MSEKYIPGCVLNELRDINVNLDLHQTYFYTFLGFMSDDNVLKTYVIGGEL